MNTIPFCRVLSAFTILLLLHCTKKPADNGSPLPIDSVSITHPDHIIFVWLENKGYPQIVNNAAAPYINSLIKKGTLFTNAYAITHPSYPNYIAFFSGNTQGISNDNCMDHSSFNTANLFTVLNSAGKSFAWYSEGLPTAGNTICQSGYYVEKHNPTTIFSNVSAIANKPFSSFPTDYNKLESVVCISPNLINDMHDGPIEQGDAWINKNLSDLVEWCRMHNSIFVIYWDEDNKNFDNRIPVVAVGQHVKNNFQLSTRYDHYNWTKTVCSMFSAPDDWAANLNSKDLITGCWQ